LRKRKEIKKIMDKFSKKARKSSVFKEIRMIPKLDAGRLQYRIGNLYDIVCLSQSGVGEVTLK
jgi:hypothetical protein